MSKVEILQINDFNTTHRYHIAYRPSIVKRLKAVNVHNTLVNFNFDHCACMVSKLHVEVLWSHVAVFQWL